MFSLHKSLALCVIQLSMFLSINPHQHQQLLLFKEYVQFLLQLTITILQFQMEYNPQMSICFMFNISNLETAGSVDIL